MVDSFVLFRHDESCLGQLFLHDFRMEHSEGPLVTIMRVVVGEDAIVVAALVNQQELTSNFQHSMNILQCFRDLFPTIQVLDHATAGSEIK